MNRVPVKRRLVRHFDNLAQVHDGDVVGQVFYNRQVVRDKQVRQIVFVAQVRQQVDDLRLNRDVQRGNRFVQNDEFWAENQSAGDAHALTLSAGELVRVSADVRRVKPALFERLANQVFAFAGCVSALNNQPFFDNALNGHSRVERPVRILKDDLHVLSQRAHLRR